MKVVKNILSLTVAEDQNGELMTDLCLHDNDFDTSLIADLLHVTMEALGTIDGDHAWLKAA